MGVSSVRRFALATLALQFTYSHAEGSQSRSVYPASSEYAVADLFCRGPRNQASE
jgi:hypothetical protein